jgi:hypothetical protein
MASSGVHVYRALAGAWPAAPPTVALLLAHATGFSAGTWRPLVAHLHSALAARRRTALVAALDFSG